jgi:glycerol-3-phosphate acyltransferase PlsY
MYVSACIPIIVFSFLLGSIPFGVLLAKAFRLPDPRTLGSGNIGATNMLRTGNKKVAALTLLLDGGKGAFSVYAAYMIALYASSMPATAERGDYVVAGCLALLSAVLGHCFSPWVRGKGGKGFATTIGGMLMLHTPIGLIMAVVWLLALAVTRYVSVASLAAIAAMLFFSAAWLGAYPFYVLAPLAAIIVYKHRSNIERLRKGEEPKLGAKK